MSLKNMKYIGLSKRIKTNKNDLLNDKFNFESNSLYDTAVRILDNDGSR